MFAAVLYYTHKQEERRRMDILEHAYGYVRVSTNVQVKEGLGIEGQKEEIQKYCRGAGIILDDIFVDGGVSGVTKEEDEDSMYRPAFFEMLAHMESVKTIIVYATDRLWRNNISAYIVQKELRRVGAKIIVTSQPNLDMNSNKPGDKLFRHVMEAFDEYSRDATVQRLHMGIKVKASKGDKPCGKPPTGYKFSSNGKTIEFDPAYAECVRKIFSYFQDTWSYAKTAQRINDEGYVTRTGKSFSVAVIRNIINNEFYIGKLVYSGEQFEGNHPHMVSLQDWDKCQIIAKLISRRAS